MMKDFKKKALMRLVFDLRETFIHLILNQKISLADIPFEQRRLFRAFYVIGNRATRHNEALHTEFIKLLFSDYSKFSDEEKQDLYMLVDDVLERHKDVISKNKIEIPQIFCPTGASDVDTR